MRIGNDVGNIGISTGNQAVILRNTVRRALGSGLGGSAIVTGAGSVVEGNTARLYTIGLSPGNGTVIRANSFAGNQADPNSFGITASGGNGALVIENNRLGRFFRDSRYGASIVEVGAGFDDRTLDVYREIVEHVPGDGDGFA